MRQTLISWAATSSFLILAVVVLRAALGKRMGAGLRYALWGLVLLRLLVPVQLFSSPVLGMVIDTERIVTRQTVTEREVLGGQDGPQVVVSAPPIAPDSPGLPEDPRDPETPVAPGAPGAPAAPAAPDWRLLPAALGWLWLAGGVVMALVLLGCNVRFWVRLRRTQRGFCSFFSREKGTEKELQISDQENTLRQSPATSWPSPFQKGACALLKRFDKAKSPLWQRGCPSAHTGAGDCLPVYVAEGLPSPCLFGVFRPAIYVSPETAADPAALRHVLAHEGTHASHGDHIWSLLRCAALCAHWWNPLVWLAAKLSRRDGELACDAGALKRLGDEERAAYGSTLLALVTAKAAPGNLLTCSTAMNGDKKSLKERFARIARAPKRAVGIAAAAVVLAALVTVCAFGQRTEEAASLEEIEADLTISMEDDSTVRITGTVDGMTLARRGAFWHPGDQLSFSGSPYGELSLVYPPLTEGIECHLSAWWADETHTAVNLSTYMMAMLSSYWPSGYWEFTVDFADGTAKVTRMEAIADFPEGMEVQMHPKTISDEEAVRAGRIAARLLTEAEEFYRDQEEKEGATPKETDAPAASESPAPAPVYVRDASENDMPGDQLVLVYQGREKPFEALWYHFNVSDTCEGTVADLNGDSRDEVVVILYEGGGTEASMSRPHIFDAETLEEYDTSWYWNGFDPYISSTGDEENFYLSVPGLSRITISKSGVTGEASDAISFGTWVEYELQDGRLVCSLNGFSRFDYVCELRAVVELDLDPDTMSIEYSFRDFAFEPSEDFEPLPEPSNQDDSPALSSVPPPAEDPADMTELPYHPDLNRNGEPETLLVGAYHRWDDPDGESTLEGVGVWEDGELLWTSTETDSPGAGNAYLLVDLDNGDYLMEYSVWSENGTYASTYLGYDLRPLGQQSIFNGDTHFTCSSGEEVAQTFDADDIAYFIENVNRLLSRSTVILDREGVFADPDAPHVSLSWLEYFAAGFTWDDSASTLENLTRFKELSLNPPEPTPVTDAAQARAELKAALLGETDFTLWGSQGKPITADIDTAPPTAFDSLSADWEKYNSFALADLDGDGVEEAVYHVTDAAGDMGGHLILRWAGPGDLRCYSIPYSHLMDLKADGSFWYSMMAGMGGMGGTVRLSFPAPGYVASMQYLTEYNVAFTPETPYKVNGEIASKEEYDAVQAKQDAKPDAVWYDFTPENVKKVLG